MQNNNDRVALFDFCETLANFQTADAYVDYVRYRLNDERMLRLERLQICLRKIKLIQLLDKITRYRYSINKRIKLWQLKGHQLSELDELAKGYYMEKIRPNLIPDMVEKLLDLKSSNYSILLVSGGYDIYLRCFADEYELNGVISTKIGFKNNVCTGRFDGYDCLRDGKVKLLNKYYLSKPKYSCGFSDSSSDIPFLRWVNDGFVVSRNNHQEWSSQNNFKEIIWIPKK
jgi:HAD superfamily phosphoserine phosphatase-like hydrolase